MNPPPTIPCWRPPPGNAIDPRVDAFRPDLADAALRGWVDAERYSKAVEARCMAARATVYSRPAYNAQAVSELALGEEFFVVKRGAHWAWGWCAHDHYVGYVDVDRFGNHLTPTHRVIARTALIFSEASIKSTVSVRPSIGSLVVAYDELDGGLIRTDHGFIHRRHLVPIGEFADDPLEVALRLAGAPYLWGGRTGEGIDCSGLVQVSLGLCGIASPRDCDQQMTALGEAIDPAGARRGDLVFFPGHVGIMADAANLLHANAFWMTTLVEPLADVVARLAPTYDQPILAVKRLQERAISSTGDSRQSWSTRVRATAAQSSAVGRSARPTP